MPDPNTPTTPPGRRLPIARLRRLLSWPLSLAVLYFWWRTARQQPLVETLAQARGQWELLTLMLVAAGLYLVGQAIMWRRVVAAMAMRIPWPVALRAWMLSNLARYLPGSVWHLVGRVEMGRDVGVERASGTLGVVLEQGMQLLSALLIVVASLPFWPASNIVRSYAWIALLVPVGLIAVHPRVFYPTLNAVLTRVGRKPLATNLTYRQLVSYTAAYVLVHLCNGLALAFAMLALGAPVTAVPAIIGGALFAWTVGYIVIFSPGGIGLRESMVSLALAPVVGGNIAFGGAVLWRVANIVTEVVGALTFDGVWRFWRRSH
jgi:hypothetical protein